MPRDIVTVGRLIQILQQHDKTLPVIPLSQDGVEELPFRDDGPITSLINPNSPDAFVSLNVIIGDD